MKIESELVQKLKDKAFQTENDKKIIESFEIERVQQLTAVEWFNQQLVDRQNGNGDLRSRDEIFEQAKEMEKEQHKVTAQDFYYGSHSFKDFEQYYKENFKQQEQ